MESIDLARRGKQILLIFAAAMLLLVAVMQYLIWLRGSAIDDFSKWVLAFIAGFYAIYSLINKKLLSSVRFGNLTLHFLTYLLINLSFHVHAYLLIINNNPIIYGSNDFLLSPGWFGVLFGMSVFWGIGLMIHAISSVSFRGFEGLPRD